MCFPQFSAISRSRQSAQNSPKTRKIITDGTSHVWFRNQQVAGSIPAGGSTFLAITYNDHFKRVHCLFPFLSARIC